MLITDSCVDFNQEVLGDDTEINRIPFKITIDGNDIIDKNLDTSDLLSRMKETKNRILTACPSPHDFLESFKKNAENYVVTISSKLSGSHNSAIATKDMFEEMEPGRQVHVFDSQSACAGESLVALKVKELLSQEISSLDIVEKVNSYISQLKTFFVLNSLDNLAKNGRISNYTAILGNLLNIVPIMGENGEGEIVLKEKVRGKKKAFSRLVDMIGEAPIDFKNTVLAITHVHALEKAMELKATIESRYPFKDVIIFEASGLSTVYADNGGIVIAY